MPISPSLAAHGVTDMGSSGSGVALGLSYYTQKKCSSSRQDRDRSDR